jgi:hypothetical protein|tara:strand:- start:207 stop:740 length:534 start_codon:yes stop_codon:yes gene_type:complete
MLYRPHVWTPRLGILVTLLVASVSHAAAQTGQPSDAVRAVVEGTWELVEWHVGDRVLRPPEMDGRWMVHDGLVMATRHREGRDGFESTAGYGTYAWGPSSWTYGYDRSADRRGQTADEALLQVTVIPQRVFKITREGDHVIMEDADQTLRWDYDIPGRTFLLMGRDRRVIRKYRRVD